MAEVQRSQRRGRSAGMGETSATLGSPPSARRRRQEQPDGESMGSASSQSDRRSSSVDRGAGQGVQAASSPTPARSGTLRSTVSVVNRGKRRTAEAQHSQRNRSPSTRPGRGSGVAAQCAGREQQRRPPAARAGTSGVQASVVRQEEVSDRSEGELSGSERDEDQGQASAVDSGRAAVRPSPGQPGDSVALVWILGHSFVFWGAKRANVRPNGRQLGIPRQEARVNPEKEVYWTHVSSDACRFALMWKYGGIYMDADVISLHPIPQDHFLAAQDFTTTSSSVFGLSSHYQLAWRFMENFVENYRGEIWGHQGPGVFTRVVKKFCGMPVFTSTDDVMCGNISYFHPQRFYPISYPAWRRYFAVWQNLPTFNDSYALHLWNFMNKEGKSMVTGSNTLVEHLYQKQCPITYGYILTNEKTHL
ncbi:lactosylceramide 4-alpha-galactosyltransferase-like isoform X1 [Aquarana catesbeiana]|uniref:lactosylceramide 4-alpha-galactosyltransferase-like isoform X1 n=1 Tax=Aquarana catesbeiana TaxID=8400 RepID=UPI003CC9B739